MVHGKLRPLHKVFSPVLAFILWLATAALGLWNIVVIQQMVYRISALFASADALVSSQEYGASVIAGQWIVYILAIVYIAVFIGGAEYHYQHVGQPQSWRLFRWTLGLELFILLLALVV
jgi:hypothetical protein